MTNTRCLSINVLNFQPIICDNKYLIDANKNIISPILNKSLNINKGKTSVAKNKMDLLKKTTKKLLLKRQKAKLSLIKAKKSIMKSRHQQTAISSIKSSSKSAADTSLTISLLSPIYNCSFQKVNNYSDYNNFNKNDKNLLSSTHISSSANVLIFSTPPMTSCKNNLTKTSLRSKAISISSLSPIRKVKNETREGNIELNDNKQIKESKLITPNCEKCTIFCKKNSNLQTVATKSIKQAMLNSNLCNYTPNLRDKNTCCCQRKISEITNSTTKECNSIPFKKSKQHIVGQTICKSKCEFCKKYRKTRMKARILQNPIIDILNNNAIHSNHPNFNSLGDFFVWYV